jgi:hypothetical protein
MQAAELHSGLIHGDASDVDSGINDELGWKILEPIRKWKNILSHGGGGGTVREFV